MNLTQKKAGIVMKKIIAWIVLLLMIPYAMAAVKPYSKVYEPETSITLAPTVAWVNDGSGLDAEALPATAMVWLDAELKVCTEDGQVISESLSDYIDETTENVIPALYIRDEATASALKAYLEETELGDVFVVSDCEHADLVQQVASLVYVRGMVDFRSAEKTLDEIVRITNSAAAKVAVLSEAQATEDNVLYLQQRLMTVWTQCGSDMKSLLNAYTSGVNGVLVCDYAAAIDALGFFDDDAPTLLRVPNIIGHRGMPSEQVENTLPSAVAAHEAGADSLEVDIYLSADDELFVVHDRGMERLFNRPEIEDVEALTLAELQQIPFDSDSENGVQMRNHTKAEDSRYGSIAMDEELHIPSLSEVYETFRGTGAVYDTEIKSVNPAIVSKLKAVAEENGVADETFVITFNTVILDEMAKTWPEMSVGALGTQAGETAGQPAYADYQRIIQKKGVEKALELLYGVIDPWNATFNPKKTFSYELAVAGRHRGLTVWPWTYNKPAEFALAYLNGIYGLTTNFTWWASDFVRDIDAQDVLIHAGDSLPAPEVTDQSGDSVQLEGLKVIVIEGSIDQPGSALCIWQLKQTMTVEGVSYGDYYLYSNPFTVTVEK